MASSIEQLKREIMREMTAAMEDAKNDMFDALQYEVAGYYTGKPDKYKRTYQLLTTPRADPVTSGGSMVSTRLYLIGNGYTTGCKPSMERVLEWTEFGGAGTIGHHGYWSRSIKTMGNAFYKAFSSHFG